MSVVTVASIVGSLCVIVVHLNAAKHETKRSLLLTSTIRATFQVLWPLVLLSNVSYESVLVAPIVWNFCMWALDSYLTHYVESANEDRPASLRFDTSIVTGLGCGLAGLVGARPRSDYSRLLVRAIVGCIMVVVPTHNVRPGTMEDRVLESIQKGVLSWCIGLVVAVFLSQKNAPIRE